MRHTLLTCLARIRECAADPKHHNPAIRETLNILSYQFTHFHFTGMMSQARDASPPRFDAPLLCLGMTWAASGCPSWEAVPQGRASWGCVQECLPGSLLLALASCMSDQVLCLCPSSLWHGAGAGLGALVTALGSSRDAPALEPRRHNQSHPRSRGCCCYFSASGFFQHRHRFSWCCHNNWR